MKSLFADEPFPSRSLTRIQNRQLENSLRVGLNFALRCGHAASECGTVTVTAREPEPESHVTDDST